MAIRLVHLYPDELNLYGDKGNVLCLYKRIVRRGYDCEIIKVGVGSPIPNFDIMFIGGGQDNEMEIIHQDLMRKSQTINYCVNANKTILAVCGGYQMLGEYYKTSGNRIIEMTNSIPFFTEGNKSRSIGNVVLDTPFGKIVGFENHSGRTYLSRELTPLGTILKGNGNNNIDKSEGVIYNNTFGTYLHGPVLPKNPRFADEIIKRGLKLDELPPLNDDLEEKCHNSLVNRFLYT